jgi:hypothetical protein
MALPKWLTGFLLHVTKSAATAMVIAGGVGLWAALKIYAAATQLGLPVALSGGVVVFAAMVTAWSSLQQIDERHQKMRLANRSPAQIGEQIRQWLWRYRFSATLAPRPDADFAMDADNDQKISVTIVKLSQNPWVSVAAGVDIDPMHRVAVTRNGDLFRYELVIALVQLGVEYEIVVDGNVITGVRINQSVWFDERINDLSFLHAIMAVRRGVRLATAMVLRLQLIDPPKQLPPPSP